MKSSNKREGMEKKELLKTKKLMALEEQIERQTLRRAIQSSPLDLELPKARLESLLEDYMVGLPAKSTNANGGRQLSTSSSSSIGITGKNANSQKKVMHVKSSTQSNHRSTSKPSTTTSETNRGSMRIHSNDIFNVSSNNNDTSEHYIPITRRVISTESTSSSSATVKKNPLVNASGNRSSARITNLLDLSAARLKSLSSGSKLVDYVFLVGPSISDLESVFSDSSYENDSSSGVYSAIVHPKILYIEKALMNEENIDILPYFCFPSGIIVTGQHVDDDMSVLPNNSLERFSSLTFNNNSINNLNNMRKNQSFVFSLTDHTSNHYGVCLIIPRQFYDSYTGLILTTNYCICLVTEYPYFSYLIYILQSFDEAGGFIIDAPVEEQVDGLILRQDLKFLDILFTRLKKQAVPSMRQHIEIKLDINNRKLSFDMLRIHGAGSGIDRYSEKELELCYHASLWALPVLLNCFPLDQILLALGCAIIEMRIIVVSPHLREVSACILALKELLRPLKWPGSVIITCPEDFFNDFVDSPVFFIIGVQRLPLNFIHTKGLAILNTSHKLVTLHDDDLVTSNTLNIPQSSKLSRLLKPNYEVIKSIFKESSMAVDSGWEQYPSNTENSDGIQIPPELNLVSESGKNLRSAVNLFCSEVNKHITTVINSAVVQDKELKLLIIKKNKRPGSMRIRAGSDASTSLDLNNNNSSDASVVTGSFYSSKELGPQGAVFIKRFLDTQMYSVYGGNDRLHAKVESKSSDSGGDKTPSTQTPRIQSSRSLLDSLEDMEDPWSTLIGIILTGTTVPSMDALTASKESYAQGKLPPSYNSNTNNLNISYSMNNSNTSSNIGVNMYKGGHFCPGGCEGKADTAECTPTCVSVWTERVKTLRHQVNLKDIVKKQYPSQLALSDIILPDGHIVCVRPRLLPIKHSKETSSQYLKRKNEVLKVDKESKQNDVLAVKNNSYHAKAKVSFFYKQKQFMSELNQRQKERILWNEKYRISVTLIQSYVRKYLIRKNLIPLVMSLMSIRRQRYLTKFRYIIAKTTLLTCMRLKKQNDLALSPRSFARAISENHGFRRVSPPPIETSISCDAFAPLTVGSLKNSNTTSVLGRIASKEEDLSSVGSAGSSSRFGLLKNSIKAWTKFPTLNRRSRANSHGSLPIATTDSVPDEERRTSAFRRASKDLIKWISSKEPRDSSIGGNSSSTTSNTNIGQHLQGERLSLPNASTSLGIVGSSEGSKDNSPDSRLSTPKEIRKVKSVDNYIKTPPNSQTVIQDPNAEMTPKYDPTIPRPIRYFHTSIFKVLVGRQRDYIIEVYKQLREGIYITKYSKSGRPKNRFLYCDREMKKLYWRSSAIVSSDEDEDGTRATNSEQRLSYTRSSLGSIVPRIDADREVLFSEMQEIHNTIITPTMVNSRNKGYLLLSPSSAQPCIVSILTINRSLDFVVDFAVYTSLYRGLRVYIDFLKRVKEHFAIYNSELGDSITSSPRDSLVIDNIPLNLDNNPDVELFTPDSTNNAFTMNTSIDETRHNRRLNSTYSNLSDGLVGGKAPLPIRSMHPAVFRFLIAQQRQLIVDFWTLLRNGVQILKHCKNGRPKIRYLYCDVDMKRLYWRSNENDRPSISAHSENSSEGERERENERRLSVKSKNSLRNSFANISFMPRINADRELFCADIIETYDTVATEVMRSSKAKGYINSTELGFMISIKTATRTLDFEIDEANFGIMNHGLKVLVGFLRDVRNNINDETTSL